jgi:transcriptional regulator with XRE-family HTH domain
MTSQLKNRTVTPDGQAIQRLRIEKGWRVEDLAKKARCSLKTVENVEKGQNVYLYTLSKFAQALGVEVSALVPGTAPPDPPKKERRFKVQLTLDIPFEEFDESEHLVSLLDMLKQIVHAKHEITVAGVEEGSTIITLEMSIDDIQSLIDVFIPTIRDKDELDAFRVEQLKLPDSEDFTLTGMVENLEDGTVSEEPLRGHVYQFGPYPGKVMGTEEPIEFMEPPVPKHGLAHPDEDE